MSKLAVLFGGQSHEHPVSLMSATSVLNNLDKKYDVFMVGITMDGRWYHFQGEIDEIANDTWENNPDNEEVILSTSPQAHGFYLLNQHRYEYVDAIFPVLHGRGGEDGTIQGLCQLNGIPCVSCDLTSSAIAMDKEYTHIICEAYGIPMAKYRVLHRSHHAEYPELFNELSQSLGLPFYVKPSKEGSSFGAHKVEDYNHFVVFVEDAFHYDEKILAEEFISGTEVGCAILGEDKTGVVYEVVVETEMYGFAEKYDGYKTNIYYPSINLSQHQMDIVKELSLKVYHALGCTVMGRADFFASENGRIIFNEINLIPGFTSHSLYPSMFIADGMDYTTLLNELIEIVLPEEK